jgi:ribosomal protein S18 acetylase RimI-like enzyme
MPYRAERITELKSSDLANLCDATEAAIKDGLGFNWTSIPVREVLEAYWRGVLMIPDRVLFGARLDGNLVGAVQLIKPPASRQSMAFCANLTNHFVAPWARGHGLAVGLLKAAEEEAMRAGFTVVRLEVRATQEQAIKIYEGHGYQCWGILPDYEMIAGKLVAGHFFFKRLAETPVEG